MADKFCMRIPKLSIAQINRIRIRNAGSTFAKVKTLLDKMEETNRLSTEHAKRPSKFGSALKKLNIF